ncbi:hypothetical protein TI39_contig4129g00006 [Zymoseptoria brevis]|uniref:Uncharacterized protein n=1 Tax=Zymoseptoria brevis TaxID=1047168 RepID=A0A0F4GCP3_9PEZI|nr:hypothetical protein TI39_contig4129g00006 [Zymoseptoria brevis]
MVNVYNCTLCCFVTGSMDDMNKHINESNTNLIWLKCGGDGCNTRFCLESQTLIHFPHCAAMRRWKAKAKYGLEITEKRVRRKCDVSEERNGQHATFTTSVALAAPPAQTAAAPSTKSSKKRTTIAKKGRVLKRTAEDNDIEDEEGLSDEDDAPPSIKPSKRRVTPAKKGVARKRKAEMLDIADEEEPVNGHDDGRVQDNISSDEGPDDDANIPIDARTQRSNKKPRVAITQEANDIEGSFPSRRMRRPAGLTYAPSWYARLEAQGHNLENIKRTFKEADTIAWKAGLGPHSSVIQQVFDEWALEEQVGENSVADSTQGHATASASPPVMAPTMGPIQDLTGEDDEGRDEGVREDVARGPVQPAGNSEVTPDIDDAVDLDNMFGQPASAQSPMRARPSDTYLPPLPALPLAPRVYYEEFQMPELSEDEDEEDDLPPLPDIARAGLRPDMSWDGQTINPQETLLHPERGRRDRAGWYRPPRDGQ